MSTGFLRSLCAKTEIRPDGVVIRKLGKLCGAQRRSRIRPIAVLHQGRNNAVLRAGDTAGKDPVQMQCKHAVAGREGRYYH